MNCNDGLFRGEVTLGNYSGHWSVGHWPVGHRVNDHLVTCLCQITTLLNVRVDIESDWDGFQYMLTTRCIHFLIRSCCS